MDSELKKPLLSDFDTVADAEEKRLFYVALTRAKHKVFVLLNNKYWSKYIHEILQYGVNGKVTYSSNLKEDQCPELCKDCQTGVMIFKQNKQKKLFKGCSKNCYPQQEY